MYVFMYMSCIFIVYYLFVATSAHTYIKILNYYKRCYMFRYFCTMFREI